MHNCPKEGEREMNNQRSPFGMKLVSALLAVLMLFSANAAAMLPVFAAEINVAPSAAIQKNVYVVDDSADPMFCYWWKGSDNGFADVDTAAAQNGYVINKFVLPEAAEGMILTTANQWADGDNADIKLTGDLLFGSLSENVFINLAAGDTALSDYRDTAVTVTAQETKPTVKEGEGVDVVSYDDFTLTGSLAEVIAPEIEVLEKDEKIASLHTGEAFTYNFGELGKHTFSFRAKDIMNAEADADKEYVVFCKAERSPVTFEDDSPMTISYNSTAVPRKVAGLQKTDKVTYLSADDQIVTVEDNKLKPTGLGSTLVYATVEENDSYLPATGSFAVEVVEGNGNDAVVFSKPVSGTVDITYGKTYTNAVVYDTKANPDAEVTYTSDAPSIASVDGNGKVTPASASDTIVTITADVTGLKNMSDAQLSYNLRVNKADMEVKGKDTTVTYEPGLKVDISKNLTVPIDELYTISYKVKSRVGLDGKPFENGGSLSQSGVLSPTRSGVFTIEATVNTANYNSAKATYKITVNKADIKNFKYDEPVKQLLVGSSYDIPAPHGETGVVYSVGEADSASVKLSGNKLTLLKPSEEGIKVSVKLPANDRYNEAQTELTVKGSYLNAGEGTYTISGKKASTDPTDTRYVGDITVTPAEDYSVALYDEDAADHTKLNFKDALTITNNVKNPRIVLKYNKAGDTAEGAVSDAIELALTLDKTAPNGAISASAFETAFDKLVQILTFNLYAPAVDCEITCEDDAATSFESGRDSEDKVDVAYYIDRDPSSVKTKQDLDALDEASWTAYSGKFNVDQANTAVVYARLTDPYGNYQYISTGGIVFDAVKPKVSITIDNNKVKNEKYFNKSRKMTVRVEEVNFKPATDMIEITAVDGAGNEIDVPEVKWYGNTALIEFKNDGHYTFRLTDKFTDLAGNVPEVEVSANTVAYDDFIIDTKKPVYEISFDNNNVKNEKYFSEARTATIKLTDDNLKGTAEMFRVTAKNTDAETPNVVWNASGNEATVIFGKNGEYTLTPMTEYLADQAGNEPDIRVDAATKAYDDFIVHLESPVVELSYDNNEAQNDKYFNSDRTATVTVRSDYFVPADGMISVTAKDAEGNDITAPEVTWNGNNATIIFDQDGVYTLTVTDQLMDQAGNGFDKVQLAEDTKAAESFVIDKTQGSAEIAYDNNSVKNELFFNNKRTATITVTDDNFVGADGMITVIAKDAEGKDITAPAVVWDGKTATIEFTENGTYQLETTEKFVDQAGNPCTLAPASGTECAQQFIIDMAKPIVNVNFSQTYGDYFKTHVKATITTTDDHFVALEDMIEVTAKDADGKTIANPTIAFAGSGFEISFKNDGYYTLKLTDAYKDLAGNSIDTEKSSAKEYAFCVDTSDPAPPVVTYQSSKENLTGAWQKLAELFTGGMVYFPEKITAVVTAEDTGSGIKSITYEAPVEGDAAGTQGVDSFTSENESLTGKYEVSFPISPEYKGKVKASALNNAGRSSATDEGMIEVSEQKPAVSLEIMNEKSAGFNDGVTYYDGDVKVKVTVEDVFFEAENLANEKTPSKLTLTVKSDETESQIALPTDWTREEGTNRYSAEITLTGDGDKVLTADYINNFNYIADTAKIDHFSIDTKDPTAVIKYDDNVVSNEKYYAQKRTATITVSDDYFKFTEGSFINLNADNKDEEDTRMIVITTKDNDGNDIAQPSFTISPDGKTATLEFEGDGHYTVQPTGKFKDHAGHPVGLKAESDNPFEFCVDTSAPKPIEITYQHNNEGLTGAWTNLIEQFTGGVVYFPDTVKVNITAEDHHSGINRIVYSAPVIPGNDEVGLEGIPETTVTNNEAGSSKQTVSFDIPAENAADYRGKISATAINNAELYVSRGTAPEEVELIAVEKTDPEITLEVVDTVTPGEYDSVNYYKGNVTVRVTVEDTFFDAHGQKKGQEGNNVVIKETTNGVVKDLEVPANDGWTRINGTNKYYRDYTLTDEGRKQLDVTYTNNAGKKAKDAKLTDFVIDKTVPKVVIKYDNNKALNEKYFNSSRNATITVDDLYFVGEKAMLGITQANKNGPVSKPTYGYNWSQDKQTATVVFSDDAFYTFNITDKFTDLAGNPAQISYAEGTVAANDFVVDKTAPNELNIVIKEVETGIERDSIDIKNNHKDQPVWVNKDVEVTLKANDELLDPSDLKLEYSIERSTAVNDPKKAYTGPLRESPDEHFVITAYVEDKAGNKSTIYSDKIILDQHAPEIDGISPEIKLNPNSNQPKIDLNGNTLYNGNVIVDYVITDRIYNNSCSGLNNSKLSYEVITDGTRTQSGTLSGATTQFDGAPQVMKGSITVDAVKNNSNNVQLIVYAMDNAQNTSQDSAKLRIDITAPVINVSYSNNSPDSTYTEYFNANRTATINISERNFNPDKVIIKATKNGATFTPGLSWNHSGSANTDDYLHTAYIEYSDDADYTFDIEYTDEASNPAQGVNYGGSVSPTKFTIDKTAPTIEISYDYNNAVNGNYYAQHRVATITIVEHNFDPGRVTFSCTANDNGTTVSAPTLNGWSSSGDVHTATVSFSNDAYYVMNISFIDMAGNAANTVPEQTFYVDTTKPEIKLVGIEKNSANSGVGKDIGFTLTTTDHNLDNGTYDFKIQRIDLNADKNKSVFDETKETRATNLIEYKEPNLKDDGIYTITCEVSDKAGNHTATSEIINEKGEKVGEDTFIFSINRLGSTFMVDQKTQQIIDKGYVQNVEEDIVVTEINPDKIDKYAVAVTKDGGQPKALTAGDNYQRTGGSDDPDKWNTYTYRISKNNFSDEAAYSVAITTTDTAGNTSFSETENPKYMDTPVAKIMFIVDRTIPNVVVNNIESGGHYNVETQTVDIVANDDNLLAGVRIMLNDDVKEYTEEELVENGGRMTFDIPSAESLQNLKIEAFDAAANSTEDTEDTAVNYVNFLVTTNLFIQFINSPLLVGLAIGGVLLIAGLIVFLVMRKRKKNA